MKKLLSANGLIPHFAGLISTVFLGITVAHGQLNPVKNLTMSGFYAFPTCCGCPAYNCFWLTWTQPDSSATDTLIGYNIYHDASLFTFLTDTSYGCMMPTQPTTCSPNWFNNAPFYIKVKAVYNIDSATSIADDSIFTDIMINVNEQTEIKSFNISPNPFSTGTTLQTDNLLQNATLAVYNCFGQMVKEIKNISGQAITLHRDNLPSGLYFLRLTQDNKVIATDKLVITDN